MQLYTSVYSVLMEDALLPLLPSLASDHPLTLLPYAMQCMVTPLAWLHPIGLLPKAVVIPITS